MRYYRFIGNDNYFENKIYIIDDNYESGIIRNLVQIYPNDWQEVTAFDYEIIYKHQHLPLFTYNQWKQLKNINMKEEFVLPEYWQIERNQDNYKMVNDWMNKHHGTYGSSEEYEDRYGLVNNKNKNKGIHQYDLPIITTEQFIKYVLKQDDVKEEKKIIGYKLKEKYKEASKRLFELCNPDKKGGYCRFDADSKVKDFYKEYEVLDLWFEPVYKEEFPQIEINGHKGEFSDTEFKFGCQKFNPEFVIKIHELQNKYNVDFNTIKDQIKQIAEYYESKK